MTRFEVEAPGATIVGDRHDPPRSTNPWLTPLVLLHAGVTDRREWRRIVPAWSATRTVITWDRRGFGETHWVEHQHDDVADLLGVLDHHHLDRAVLVGHSMGAAIALDAALAEPDRIAGLLLITPNVNGAPAPESFSDRLVDLDEAIDAAMARDDIDEANRLEAELWLDGPASPPGRVTDTAVRELFLAMNRRALSAPPTGDEIEHPAAWPRLGDLDIPTHVVAADLDAPYLMSRAEHVAATVRDATSTVMHDVAHLPTLEAPDRLLQVCGPFLAAMA